MAYVFNPIHLMENRLAGGAYSLRQTEAIKASIYGKYGLVYEDGVLNKLIVASSLDNNFSNDLWQWSSWLRSRNGL
ncbi:MAG: hypothetical protein MRQ11_00215 [Candidatus Midichloria mitochondrii]|nr:hypothetical protein [Candidatus Midichloria mitochondrii]MDJ1313472.1 hypothetical protein [Candidatus Midichloria mitochondrii]MDJ1583122.1 hypothetical protein [Candidatus Midichloria mitochondrii]